MDKGFEKLSNLCDRIGDGLHGTPQYTDDSNIYFINGNNLKNGKIEITENTKSVSQEELKNNFISLNENSLLLSINGTLGSMAFYNNENIILGKSAAYLNFKSGINKFYYYYFQLPNIQKYFYDVATGSTIKNLSLKSIQDFIVPVFDENKWKSIAAVLSALDAKIELNNRINAELEAMAKTLYDYWFVQFDFPSLPSSGGIEGGYKSSGGSMVWNEEVKREVPQGWEVGTLLDIAIYDNGLPCQKFRPTDDEFLRVIKIREMNEGFSANTELVRPNIPAKAIIQNADILFSWSASLDVKIWAGGIGALNQHIFKVSSTKYPKSFYYHQLLNYLQHFKMMAENRKTTMGHITQEHLRQSRIVIPPLELIEQLDKILTPLYEIIIKNQTENQDLTALRDWLLPLLMNGQVRAQVGEVRTSPTLNPEKG